MKFIVCIKTSDYGYPEVNAICEAKSAEFYDQQIAISLILAKVWRACKDGELDHELWAICSDNYHVWFEDAGVENDDQLKAAESVLQRICGEVEKETELLPW